MSSNDSPRDEHTPTPPPHSPTSDELAAAAAGVSDDGEAKEASASAFLGLDADGNGFDAADAAAAARRFSKSNSLRAQSAKFIITGGISAVVDLTLTWLFQIQFGLLDRTGARTVGFVAGTALAYFLNRRWTFNAKASTSRLAAVAATYGLTYLVNLVLYRLVFDLLDEQMRSTTALFIAFCVAQGTATLINFFIQRWVIFRSTRKQFLVEP